MSYLEFLVYFLILPLCLEIFVYFRQGAPRKKELFFALSLLVFLAVSYTTPWDNYLVKSAVWSYGQDRVIGVWGYVPIEEYFFFVLQTLFSGLGFFLFWNAFRKEPSKESHRQLSIWRNRNIPFLGLLLMWGLSLPALYVEKLRYAALIVSWSFPVIMLQLFVGWEHLARNRRAFLSLLFLFSAYLWVADALAIYWGIWTISERFTIGWEVFGLPFEEALFFVVTNVMVIQGVCLFVEMDALERLRSLLTPKRKLAYHDQ